jgi:hypothetical protein
MSVHWGKVLEFVDIDAQNCQCMCVAGIVPLRPKDDVFPTSIMAGVATVPGRKLDLDCATRLFNVESRLRPIRSLNLVYIRGVVRKVHLGQPKLLAAKIILGTQLSIFMILQMAQTAGKFHRNHLLDKQ